MKDNSLVRFSCSRGKKKTLVLTLLSLIAFASESNQESPQPLGTSSGEISANLSVIDPGGPGFEENIENYIPPETFTYNFNEINNVTTDVPTLTTDLMGDRIDPSTGTISWSHTDVTIPGNFDIEVSLTRTLEDTGNWFGATRELGNWSLAIPHVRSTYVTEVNGSLTSAQYGVQPAWYRDEACSAGLNANPDFHKLIKEGTTLYNYELKKEDYWQGDTISIPGVGSQKILQDGSTKKTTSLWKVECVDVNGVDGFKVTLPDGKAYTFGNLKTVKSLKDIFLVSVPACIPQCTVPPLPGESLPNEKARMQMVHAFMQVTEIRDRFGNWVKYDYDSNGNLDKITSSDSRTIDVTFTSGSDARLQSVTANGRQWSYSYEAPTTSNNSSVYRLKTVTRPDSKTWQFDYPDSNAKFWRQDKIAETTQLESSDSTLCYAYINGDFVTITHPGGAVGTFTLKERCIGQAAVPKLPEYNAFGQGGPYQRYGLQIASQQFAVSKKVLNLGDGTEYQWDYNYGDIEGYFYGDAEPGNTTLTIDGMPSYADISFIAEDIADVNATLVSNPDGSHNLAVSDRRYGYLNGQQLYSATYDNNFNLISYTAYTHSPSPTDYGDTKEWVSAIPEYMTNPVPPEFTGQNAYDKAIASSKHIRLTERRIALKDGGVNTFYEEAFSNFNTYENAQLITQDGPSGNRRVKLGFAHSTATWVFNKPTTVDVSINNEAYKRLSEMTYYSATSSNTAYRFQVKNEKYFGTTRKTYTTYHGAIAYKGQVRHVDLHLNTAGSKRRITFENYKRGIAQTVTAPKRYTTGTMSMTKEVDDNGWVTATTNFNGITTRYGYNDVGLITAVDLERDVAYVDGNWRDRFYSYSYPSSGGLVRTIKQCILNSAMDACSGNTSVTTTETYDTLYRLTKRKINGNSENRYQLFDYNANNQTIFESYVSSSSSESRGTTSTYDALRRLNTQAVSGLGTTQYQYLADNAIEVVNARGYATTTTYRAFAAPSYKASTLIESPESVTTQIVYDTFANVKSVTQSGGGKSQTENRYYDSNNNLCLVTRNDIGNVQSNYNLLGELQWQAHGSVNSCTSSKPSYAVDHTYDNLGDIRYVNYPDSTPDIEYILDNVGNVKTLKAGSVTNSYTYNNQNLVESESISIPGRSGSLNVDYQYDRNLHLSVIVYPGGNRVVNLTPNAFGEPTNINRSGRTFASNIDFYPHGVIDHFTYGNSVVHDTALFSQSNLPSRISDMKGTTRVAWFDYTYDNNANIKSILDGTDSGYNLTSITYDGLDRLKTTTGGAKAGSTSVNYDALGNITSLNTLNRTLSYAIDNNLNRISSVSSSGSNAKAYGYFNYDTRGNITHNSHFSMSYNLANQMTAANGLSFTYDGYNRRVKSTKSGSTSYYHYSQDGKLLFSEENGVWKNYIYLGNRLIAEDASSSTTFLHTDSLGSTVAKTNTSGSVLSNSRRHYKPFGDTYESSSHDIGYTGHKFDNDLGLSYMQARYYDPVIGRFYSNDPVDAVSHLSNEEGIKGFNRYSYAVNNPYKYIDPDGKAVFYFGSTGGANAGTSGATAVGLFANISSDGIILGTYESGEVGSSTATPGADLGLEFGASTGAYGDVLNGPYMVAGVEGTSGVGGSIATTSSLSSDPEIGIQITLQGGTPQTGAYLHTGGGTAQEVISISSEQIKSAFQEYHGVMQQINEAIGFN